MLDKIDIGNIVLVIGRPREFASEKYILIETIKKINPAWAKVRKLELIKNLKISNSISNDNNLIKEEIVKSSTNEIIKIIKELDKGDGVSIENLSLKNINDLDKIIDMLLKEGDIFEIKPGKLKVL